MVQDWQDVPSFAVGAGAPAVNEKPPYESSCIQIVSTEHSPSIKPTLLGPIDGANVSSGWGGEEVGRMDQTKWRSYSSMMKKDEPVW
jgi:hypothetical protein